MLLRLSSAIALGLLASACGGASFEFSIGGVSVEDAAVTLIEDDISAQVGMALEADCPAVPDPDVGTEFSCTATTPDGAVIEFAGLIDEEDHIDLSSTNVIRADRLDVWERSGAGAVSELIGGPVEIDCGPDAVVLDPASEMTCVGTDQFGEAAPIIYTITDLDAGDYDIRIGE